MGYPIPLISYYIIILMLVNGKICDLGGITHTNPYHGMVLVWDDRGGDTIPRKRYGMVYLWGIPWDGIFMEYPNPLIFYYIIILF